MNVSYHKGLFQDLLTKVGYEAKPLIEGHAVVFAELADDDFTGIGISCGGGMFNVCVAYKTIPALSFATSRGGDWVDRNVAQVLGIKASKATALKERGIDLRTPKDREEQAVEIYYRELIRYTLKNIKERFESSEGMPTFPDPVDIVFAGGTSLIGGFDHVVREELDKLQFPIDQAGPPRGRRAPLGRQGLPCGRDERAERSRPLRRDREEAERPGRVIPRGPASSR